MSPALQVMDYGHEIETDPDSGLQSLRVTCDPSLDSALAAARRAERRVDEIVRQESARWSDIERAWLRRYARVVTQAVEWRTLAEPNVSHTNRRPQKMGSFLAEALGEGYKTVSMLAGSGEYLYFGNVAQVTEDSPLEQYSIILEDAGPLARALDRLSSGGVIARIAPFVTTTDGRKWVQRWGLAETPLPDVAILVRKVLPLRRPDDG